MNDVMEQIKTLSATLDEETTRFHPTGRLLLLGYYESVFLKAVKRKADLLGIDCDLTQYPCPPYKAVVVDRETGVNYLVAKFGTGGGICPLIDKDGKPIISE